MMATTQEGRDFGYEFFDRIIEWIEGYLDVEDVFSYTQLDHWAIANGYIKEDVVYDEKYLIDWAMTNGYIKEEDCLDE